MTRELEAAVSAARAAGDLLCKQFGAVRQVRHKGPTDLVSEMDHQAQELIASTLGKSFPTYGLVGEEGDEQPASDGPRWLVDPIDGTVNYIRGYPLFAVSIALERDAEIALGVVYNPILDELFIGEKDKGATLNGRSICVSTTASLSQSVLASGFPYDVWTTDQADNSREWRLVLKRALSLRCDACASLDLCHLAMGRIDGYWELELGPWDMAAGALIVQEAGGAVTQMTGDPFDPYAGNMLASNGYLHADMLALLARERA
jgi:myo-inositol-1(or 4)-monophosphatase